MLLQFGKNYPDTLSNLFNFKWQKSNTIRYDNKERKRKQTYKTSPTTLCTSIEKH